MVQSHALFDSSRKALHFALNAVKVKMPQPFMNKAMAESPVKPKRRKKVKPGTENAAALELLSLDEAPEARKMNYAVRMPTGLDAAAQAGFILRQLDRLDPIHKAMLCGVTMTAYHPCECRAACCSGERVNPTWATVVKDVCELLKEAGDITKTKGKRGLSTHPVMRWSLVEQYFTQRHLKLVDIATQCKVSLMTATKHREWIHTYMKQSEQEAWIAVDLLFDQAGITGSIDGSGPHLSEGKQQNEATKNTSW